MSDAIFVGRGDGEFRCGLGLARRANLSPIDLMYTVRGFSVLDIHLNNGQLVHFHSLDGSFAIIM